MIVFGQTCISHVMLCRTYGVDLPAPAGVPCGCPLDWLGVSWDEFFLHASGIDVIEVDHYVCPRCSVLMTAGATLVSMPWHLCTFVRPRRPRTP